MDWSKAKSILIIALLATNLILFSAIYMEKDRVDGTSEDTIKEDTILLLESHGIYVDPDLIPEKDQQLPVLFLKYVVADPEKIELLVEESDIDLQPGATEEEFRQAADSLVQKAGFYQKSLTFQNVTVRDDQETVVHYGMEYAGYPVDNCHLSVTFRKGKPAAIDINWAEPFSVGKNKKQVMTALTALIKFMAEQEDQVYEGQERIPIYIDQISLVYWLEGYTGDSSVSEDTAVPYWRIDYNGDQTTYIPGYE